MKKLTACVIFLLVISVFSGCSKYSEQDFLGKTSAEIVEQYGEFDCIGMPADADNLYRNTVCGYTIREARVGFLGSDPEELFFIRFDENGIAASCYEGYRPGG